jgi:hypothetical protein
VTPAVIKQNYLRLGDQAPNFVADSTEGKIEWHKVMFTASALYCLASGAAFCRAEHHLSFVCTVY